MEERFTVHRDVQDDYYTAAVEDCISGYFSSPPSDTHMLFDRTDIDSAIHRLRPKNALSEGRIGTVTLQNASPRLMSLVQLFDSYLRLHHFPMFEREPKS